MSVRRECIINSGISVGSNSIWMKSHSGRRVFYFPAPSGSLLYRSLDAAEFRWVFRSKDQAKAFWQRFRTYSARLNRIFFLRFRLRGLGYRFRKIADSLYRFYFTKTNYIYFHKPTNLYLFSRKRRIIILSADRHLLHSVFRCIIRLHRPSPYNKRGFVYPRRMLRRKPGKKII